MPRVSHRVVMLAAVVLAAVGISRTAPAQPKVTEVLIGSVLPLTGNFASLGQQYLWSAQTAEDIVNNDYDIQVPLGPGKGFPGLGGATMKMIVRDDQSRGEQARTIVESIRIAAARPKPICLMSSDRRVTKIANTATITTAALVTVPAVRLIPVATASSVGIP